MIVEDRDWSKIPTHQAWAGGIGYFMADYSGSPDPEVAARKWEVVVSWSTCSPGGPKQVSLVARGLESLEQARKACAADMRRRSDELLSGANELDPGMKKDGKKRHG